MMQELETTNRMPTGTEYGEEVAYFINSLKRNLDPEFLEDSLGANPKDMILQMAHTYISAIMGRHIECPATLAHNAKQDARYQASLDQGMQMQAALLAFLTQDKEDK